MGVRLRMPGRLRVCAVGVILLLAAGCSNEAAATEPGAPATDGPASPPPSPVEPYPEVPRPPAAEAGGACEMFDFDVVEQTVGFRFEVAAASTHEKTQSCLLRPDEEPLPDLMVSISDTKASAAVFADDVAPVGAKKIDNLGKAAYWIPLKPDPDTGYGAALEVNWITADPKSLSLRWTFAPGDDELSAVELAPKMVELARVVHENRKK
ncbi:hypothetical protein [Micromonospora sp. NBC_01813]|uniref:hypothetical protein n=1 Tax=Micromonospora sp. NBC_01813 TaxID=2975988 RepID=UPI002DDB5C6F|nr:hypothetical protein [Micromonospora sp. NBC_01813]WSA11590.1 hypothetical protein OG958_12845 [Micromonospora sp. NBC_01813]